MNIRVEKGIKTYCNSLYSTKPYERAFDITIRKNAKPFDM